MPDETLPKSPYRGPRWLEWLGRVSWLTIGIALASAVVVLGIISFSNIVTPLVVAAFFAAVFLPMVGWLADRGLPRAGGAVLVIVAIGGFFFASVALIVIGVVDESDELSSQLDAAEEELSKIIDNQNLEKYVEQVRDGFGDSPVFDGLGSQLGSVVGSTVDFFAGLVLAVVLLYYLLKEGPAMIDGLLNRHRPEQAETYERIINTSIESVRSYVRGRTLLALVQGVAVGVVVWIMGVPLPLSIALVTFITAYIPYLGGLLGGAFAVLMALSVGGLSLALWALALVLFVNLVLENALEPLLTGSSLDLHPVIVLLVTVIGGMIAGAVGLILASPITAILRNLYRELKDSGFFDPTEQASGDPSNLDA